MCEDITGSSTPLTVTIENLDAVSALLGCSRVKLYRTIEEAETIGVSLVVMLESLDDMISNAIDHRDLHEHKVLCLIPSWSTQCLSRVELVRCWGKDCNKSVW